MTQAVTTTLPPVRSGGGLRRLVVAVASLAVWSLALLFLGSTVSPDLAQPTNDAWTLRVPLLLVGLLLVAAPVLVVALPTQRRMRRMVAAVLGTSQGAPRPVLPAVATWGGPEKMFRRMRWTSYTWVSLPLLLLDGSAVAFGLFLGEPGAGLAFGVLGLIPLFFLVLTLTLPRRLWAGVEAGLAAGQVVPLRIDSRIDQKLVLNDAFQSWFDAVLPDGQRLVLRTPRHFTWCSDARGVVESPDLVMVIGKDGHHGVVLAPGRPDDAVWLLGPVPQVRVPSSVQRAFAGDLVRRPGTTSV